MVYQLALPEAPGAFNAQARDARAAYANAT